MKSTAVDIPIHDIGPLLEIREYSLYWFLGIIAVVLVVIVVIVRQRGMKKKLQKVNKRKVRYEDFCRIDVSDSKRAAYAICEQGSFFAHDNEQILSAYGVLFERLEPYKYAPKVEPMDEEILALYRSYQKMVVL